MAIKDQCLQCRLFNVSSGVCGKTGATPILNYSSCDMYQKKGISLEKSSTLPSSNPTNPIVPPASPKPSNNAQQTGNKGMFRHIFSFDGRIRRLEFGLTYLMWFGVRLLYNILLAAIPYSAYGTGIAMVYIWLLLQIPILWIMFAQGAKRCHDMGHNGWWQLIPFYVFWMIFQDGDMGTNEYGDNPKN